MSRHNERSEVLPIGGRWMARMRAEAASCVVVIAAALVAIAASLIVMSLAVLTAGAAGFGGSALSGQSAQLALNDGAVALYLVQMVKVSLFTNTAGLRFASLTGLAVVAMALAISAALAVRLIGGSTRRRLLMSSLIAVPYALVSGLGARYIPLHATAPLIGKGTPVSPAGAEAFLLPLAWGLLFASAGGLVGVFGRRWRHELRRAAGAWATPISCAIRGSMLGLAAASLAVVASGVALFGIGGVSWALGNGDLGHLLNVAGGALLTLPTIVIAVFLACFGVSFDWQVEALSSNSGSVSALGGTWPTAVQQGAHGIAGAFALLLLAGALTLLYVGWTTARRSPGDARASLANVLRAGAAMTLICWFLALLARADAQMGGLMGAHLAASTSSLLWGLPAWCLLATGIGGVMQIAVCDASARQELALVFLDVVRPSRAWQHFDRPSSSSTLLPRTLMMVSVLSLPATLVGLGSTSTPKAPTEAASLAPIARAAEQRLHRFAPRNSRHSVLVDPSTRVVDSARVKIPVATLGVSTAQPAAIKAKAMLTHYGDVFGISRGAGELGTPKVVTERATSFAPKPHTHVYFNQIIDGIPVYGANIGVHLSPDGHQIDAVSGSFIPEVTLATDKPAINVSQAVLSARTALPGGKLVHKPRLEVYAGPPSHIYGPTAHLAWFVWLSTGPLKQSREYVVDATTGTILSASNMSFHSKEVVIDTAEEKTTLPGKQLWKEGETEPKDQDGMFATLYVKKSWEFFGEHLKQPLCEGYECKGKPPLTLATVHYSKSYEEAEWNAEHQEIVFGNGFPKALDVVGHEYAGGISEHMTHERVEGETGALLEGWADAMGKGLEAWAKKSGGTWTEPNWIFGYNEPGGKKRNLEKPKEYSEIAGLTDPENLTEYRTACQDNGDVHENSTIISHAFYLLAQKIGVQNASNVFWKMQVVYFKNHPFAELEQAPGFATDAAEELFTEASKIEAVQDAFEKVGLDGVTKPPPIKCTPCPPSRALAIQAPSTGTAPTLAMLATLYRARGELAQPSAAGHYFMPLYEANTGRIAELVSRDPTLAETTVSGLHEIEPALNALAEGRGKEYKLSSSVMTEIEAALKRLAQDDRLFSGGGSLAKLIDRELKWMRLPTYAGMTYATGFKKLNDQVAGRSETPPPPAIKLIDPTCEKSYTNAFHIFNFNVSTPGHYKSGEVAPINATGVACGTVIEAEGANTECGGEATLNTQFALKLPPGDKINSTKEMKEGAWVGKMTGSAFGCAGTHSQMLSGETGIKAVKSWTVSQCPTSKVIACYKTEGKHSESFGTAEVEGYAYVEEAAGGRLTLKALPVKAKVTSPEGTFEAQVGFAQVGVALCPRAGEPETEECGNHLAQWVHKNGTESEPGCKANENGRYVMTVTNASKETSKTTSEETCVYWGEEVHKETVDPGNSLTGISCIPATTDCVTVDNKGNALYATTVSTTGSATWKPWTGPTSPGEAIACPTTSLCAFGDGKVTEGGGGKMYYATSLGGSWTEAFAPTHGVLSASCPSSSFCLAGEEKGAIRYSTTPGSASWTELTIGTGSINSVFCLSASFCAAVNSTGEIYVANSEAHVKEAAGWKATDIDGATALHGVACNTTTACVAVDGEGHILTLVINGSAEAAATKRDIDATNNLTAATCTGERMCIAVDNKGNIFVSSNGGGTWNDQHPTGTNLTAVSCSSMTLCVTSDTTGNVTAFAPTGVPPSVTEDIDGTNKLSAASCIPETKTCVATDSKGNAFLATNVRVAVKGTWKSWSGPASPSWAVACPTTSLCALADGTTEEGGGGKLYYATSIGGTWKEAFAPSFGVDAISCPSAAFCVAGQAEGIIHYSTNPASSEWTGLSIATHAINAVDCLSSAFCAVADGGGKVYVANTEAKIKEEKGWKASTVDGTVALHGIACTTTTWCVAIDGEGHALGLMINASGEATATSEDIDGTNDLTAITCAEEMCVITDSKGNVFASANSGETWHNTHALGTDLTSVTCSAKTLCLATTTTGEVTAFAPE